MKLTFIADRETPGTLVFAEVDSKGKAYESKKDAVVGSLYIRKGSEIGKQAPKKITVDITVAK